MGVYQVYHYFDRWTSWTAYIDTFTTALFFVGMWLMARRKIEHWIFWIIGDIISVPLYFYKGLTITSLQYIYYSPLLLFTAIAHGNKSSNFVWLPKGSIIRSRKHWKNNLGQGFSSIIIKPLGYQNLLVLIYKKNGINNKLFVP